MKKIKLKLNRETVHNLSATQLGIVQGGVSITGSSYATYVNCTTNVYTNCRCVTTIDTYTC